MWTLVAALKASLLQLLHDIVEIQIPFTAETPWRESEPPSCRFIVCKNPCGTLLKGPTDASRQMREFCMLKGLPALAIYPPHA